MAPDLSAAFIHAETALVILLVDGRGPARQRFIRNPDLAV